MLPELPPQPKILTPLTESDLQELGRTIDLLRSMPTRQNAQMAQLLARLVIEIRALWHARDSAVGALAAQRRRMEALQQDIEALGAKIALLQGELT